MYANTYLFFNTAIRFLKKYVKSRHVFFYVYRDGNEDCPSFEMEIDEHNPLSLPSSLVPRIHAVASFKLQHSNPLLDADLNLGNSGRQAGKGLKVNFFLNLIKIVTLLLIVSFQKISFLTWPA